MCAIYDESNWQDFKKKKCQKRLLVFSIFSSVPHINAFALYKIKTTAQKQKHAETNERYDHPRLRRAGGRGIRSFHGRCEVRYSLRGLILKSQTRKISSFCSLSRSRVSSSLLLNILTLKTILFHTHRSKWILCASLTDSTPFLRQNSMSQTVKTALSGTHFKRPRFFYLIFRKSLHFGGCSFL